MRAAVMVQTTIVSKEVQSVQRYYDFCRFLAGGYLSFGSDLANFSTTLQYFISPIVGEIGRGGGGVEWRRAPFLAGRQDHQ